MIHSLQEPLEGAAQIDCTLVQIESRWESIGMWRVKEPRRLWPAHRHAAKGNLVLAKHHVSH